MNAADDLGTFERHGDRVDLRFERVYGRPIEKVWKALTEPERLADWMGQCVVEPFVGGRFETMLDGQKPMRGRVRIWQAPTLLEYDWHNDHAPASIARWELSTIDTGTRVIFEHRGVPYASSNLMMPGWHTYLSHLGSALQNQAAGDFGRTWRELQEVYAQAYGLEDLTREP